MTENEMIKKGFYRSPYNSEVWVDPSMGKGPVKLLHPEKLEELNRMIPLIENLDEIMGRK